MLASMFNEHVTPLPLEDPQEFAALARLDWVVARSWHRLHALPYGPWTWEQADDIAFEWSLYGPVMLACRRMASMVCIPGVGSRDPRGGLPRCSGCCRATGMIPGIGSPKNSDECRKLLGLP